MTEEFGWRSGHEFLTGAIFADRNGDNFYTPGEGLGGVSVSAVGLHGEGTFSTATWGSGGYSLDLPSGSYAVTASGGGLASPRTTTITIGKDNIGWDVAVPSASAAPVLRCPPGVPVATAPRPPAERSRSPHLPLSGARTHHDRSGGPPSREVASASVTGHPREDSR